MAVSSVKKMKHHGLMTLLSAVACEWFLILLLCADALFSYLITRFALYCELQTPCPLCAWLDHIFEQKKQEHYWGLVCSKHKEEISSLVSCSGVHRKLHNAKKLPELNPVVFGPSKPNPKPPLPRVPGRGRFSRRDSLKRLRDKFTRKTTHRRNSIDTLSHVGYSKLKILSDSESEFPFSDDDDGYASCSGNSYIIPKNDFEFGRRTNVVSDKQQTYCGSEMKDQLDLLDLNKPNNVVTTSSDSLVELISLHDVNEPHSLAEIFKFSLPHSSAISALSELLSLHTVPSSSNTVTLPKKPINMGEKINKPTVIHIKAAENVKLSCEHEVEPINAFDSGEPEEDTNSVLQVSAFEGRAKDEHNESRKDEDSSYEPLDGISVSDIEGEDIVDRLKRQVQHDRKCMNCLYKELEEERSAAAVAANQAMAMITRLQEEKAALHMDALQYLRMMEEQVEYDMEALRRANDLLAEKEKELQDLEYELEFYRNNNFLDEPGIENRVSTRFENGSSNSSDSKSTRIAKENGVCESLSGLGSDFEDEKLYVSQCLKKLVEKIRQAYCDEIKCEVGNPEDFPPYQDAASNGTPDKGNECRYERSDNLSERRGDTNLSAFMREIALLNERLEALETDRDFLKHASNLFRNGKDGEQLNRDIAHQLRELREIEFGKR